jgi:hypothetical protein
MPHVHAAQKTTHTMWVRPAASAAETPCEDPSAAP